MASGVVDDEDLMRQEKPPSPINSDANGGGAGGLDADGGGRFMTASMNFEF